MTEKTKYDKFGVDKETFEKSKDILPSFDLGKIEEGSNIYGTFLSKEPVEIEHKNKFVKEGGEKTLKTPTLTIAVDKVVTSDGSKIPYSDKYTLWLSSKSLRLGILKVFDENNEDLTGTKFKIRVTTVDYKEFGENRCYNVEQII